VYAAKFFAELTPEASEWIPLGDNCAHNVLRKTDTDDGYNYMYKIFDDRYRQTYRSPDLWLAKVQNKPGGCAPWLKKLKVEKILEVEEPHAPELNKEYTLGTVNSGPVRYGCGKVLVLRYDYIEGAHVPKSLYSFVSVAKQLKEMHDRDYVHGDIRAYNMVFGQTQNDADKAWLIDFDFSGKENGKCYPPGYSSLLVDLVGRRAGEPDKPLEKKDDWTDLLAVMQLFTLFEDEELEQLDQQGKVEAVNKALRQRLAWEVLRRKYNETLLKTYDGLGTSLITLLEENLDGLKGLPVCVAIKRGDFLCRFPSLGTGSPNKKNRPNSSGNKRKSAETPPSPKKRKAGVSS
jgi:Lipopolysaccharide kinase (Kdo/WaaP) family